MTLPIEDERVIVAADERYNARIVERHDETETLAYFKVRFDGEPVRFDPGQYMTIGVFADDKLWQRPYSIASAPTDAGDGYEFYVRLVPIIRFTTLLWRLEVGQGMRMTGPKGRFLLEPDDKRTHLFVSTGTGIAPFISMIRETMAQKKPRKTVVLHGVSYADELGYRDVLEGWERDGTYPVRYVPTVSRPERPAQRGLGGAHGARRGRHRRRLQGPGAAARPDCRVHLRQPGDDPQRRGRPHEARLPGVPREEGALLAEGQGRAGARGGGIGRRRERFAGRTGGSCRKALCAGRARGDAGVIVG